MKAFIRLTKGEEQFLIATSAIVSISKSGEGVFITLSSPLDGFDPNNNSLYFDIPFADIASRLATDITELKKYDKQHRGSGPMIIS